MRLSNCFVVVVGTVLRRLFWGICAVVAVARESILRFAMRDGAGGVYDACQDEMRRSRAGVLGGGNRPWVGSWVLSISPLHAKG